MPLAPPANRFGWPQSLAAILMVLGLAATVASFLLPTSSTRRAAWSDAQARKYQAASIKLHSLSHEAAHIDEASGHTSKEHAAVHDELAKAQVEYDVLRGELDSALGRPKRLAWLLRTGGILALVFGGAIIYLLPPPATDDDF